MKQKTACMPRKPCWNFFSVPESSTAQTPVNKLLRVNEIACRYGDHVIIPSLSFEVTENQIACLLGR